MFMERGLGAGGMVLGMRRKGHSVWRLIFIFISAEFRVIQGMLLYKHLWEHFQRGLTGKKKSTLNMVGSTSSWAGGLDWVKKRIQCGRMPHVLVPHLLARWIISLFKPQVKISLSLVLLPWSGVLVIAIRDVTNILWVKNLSQTCPGHDTIPQTQAVARTFESQLLGTPVPPQNSQK